MTTRSVPRELAALGLAASLVFLLPGASGAELRGMKMGEILAPRNLPGLSGQEMVLPAPGGLTVVVFFATWSPRSLEALSHWQTLARDYAQHPLTILAVDADHQKMEEGDVAAVRTYLQENRITLPAAVDGDLSLYNQIGVMALPTTLFFKNDGALVSYYPGFPSSAALDLREELERQLGIARPEEEGKKSREFLANLPRNNALLYHNMGNLLLQRGMHEKAWERWMEALRRDGGYAEPLRALEEDFFREGRTPEREKALSDLLEKAGLPGLASRYKPKE